MPVDAKDFRVSGDDARVVLSLIFSRIVAKAIVWKTLRSRKT
jgi:hypothetical protein